MDQLQQQLKCVNGLKICSFNCRSFKSSLEPVRHLCNLFDIVLLQEHWLLPHELSLLNLFHSDFILL
jgi:hypothetical protein